MFELCFCYYFVISVVRVVVGVCSVVFRFVEMLLLGKASVCCQSSPAQRGVVTSRLSCGFVAAVLLSCMFVGSGADAYSITYFGNFSADTSVFADAAGYCNEMYGGTLPMPMNQKQNNMILSTAMDTLLAAGEDTLSFSYKIALGGVRQSSCSPVVAPDGAPMENECKYWRWDSGRFAAWTAYPYGAFGLPFFFGTDGSGVSLRYTNWGDGSPVAANQRPYMVGSGLWTGGAKTIPASALIVCEVYTDSSTEGNTDVVALAIVFVVTGLGVVAVVIVASVINCKRESNLRSLRAQALQLQMASGGGLKRRASTASNAPRRRSSVRR